MKIGVIGAGNWGKNLVKNFANLGVLHAVADGMAGNREAAKEIAPEIAVYKSAEELIQAGEVDAVAVATPPHTHHSIATQAMQAGLDVFVEKPLTLDAEESADLVKTAKELDRILMVGHLLMYQPAIRFIKEYLDAGKLGKVFTMAQRRSKLGRVRKVENVLWSFGVHDVAVLLYLAGEQPVETKYSEHCAFTESVADDAHLHMVFPSGVTANLHNSWFWPRVERELIITGSNGILEFNEISSKVIRHKKTIDTSDLSHHDDGEGVLFEGTSQPLKLELEHFLDCLKTRKQPISNGENGHNVVKLLQGSC